MPDPDLRALLESWIIHLRAERKAEGTVRLYAIGVRAFLAWCDRQGRPVTLDRPTVAAFVAGLLNDGREAATARARQLALRRLAAWMADEGELAADGSEGGLMAVAGWARRDMLDRYAAATASERAAAEAKSLNLGDL